MGLTIGLFVEVALKMTNSLCSDRSVSVQEYMLTVLLGEELVVLGTSRTFLESPLRVIALL